MDTLLVIDMQNAWLNGETGRYDKLGVIARINQAIEGIRKARGRVLFVRHNDAGTRIGTDGWQIDPRLRYREGDPAVEKTACDAFLGTDLLEQLKTLGTKTIHICGLATEFCIDTTVRASVSHGFDVVVLADAHTTGDREHLSAESIIAHHNWIWANMAIPHERALLVRRVDEVFS